MYSPENIREKGKRQLKASRKLAERMKKLNPRQLDDTMQAIHEEVFETMDCLQCANCCKTTSPIFRPADIDRLSKHLRMRPAEFIEKYLVTDEDNDYVLRSAPCPFLDEANYCKVYESRPAACREYPHTDRKKFYQLLDLTLRNSLICPAVQQMLEKLETKL